MIQENLTNYEFGIVLAELDQTKFDAMFKYHLIPSEEHGFIHIILDQMMKAGIIFLVMNILNLLLKKI